MKNKNIIMLIIGIMLFIFSMILDKNAAYFVTLIKNPAFDLIFNWFTSFINVFVILILVTTLFLFEEKKREWILPLWLSMLLSFIISFTLKLIISRPRPSFELIYPMINTLNYSFPSMHAMIAFAAVPILDREFSKLKWFWVIFAFLVSFSRIYLDFHFLSDVVFGGFFGYFIGVFVVHIEEKYRPFGFLK